METGVSTSALVDLIWGGRVPVALRVRPRVVLAALTAARLRVFTFGAWRAAAVFDRGFSLMWVVFAMMSAPDRPGLDARQAPLVAG